MTEPTEPVVEVIAVPFPDPDDAATPAMPGLPREPGATVIPPVLNAAMLTDRRLEIEVADDGEPRLRIIDGVTGKP